MRGIGRKVRAMKKLINRVKPEFVLLQETKKHLAEDNFFSKLWPNTETKP